MPEELIELLSVEHARDLGTGPAFGSVEQMVTELSYSQVNSILPEVRRAVLFFDGWIFNADRMLTESGGNPNLFWGPDTQRLVVIDHNQAFDSEFSNEDLFKLHVFKDCAPGFFGLFGPDGLASGEVLDQIGVHHQIRVRVTSSRETLL